MFTSRQINVFRAIMSTGSITNAADRLNLSQPSVSRLLGELERQFGCALFIRKSRGVTPTPEAYLFLDEVERTYAALASLEETAREISLSQRGVVSFGCIAAFSFDVVPRALISFGIPKNPIAVNWRMRSSSQLLHWISSGLLDLAIIHIEGETAGVKEIYRRSLPHMCLLTQNHPLAKKGESVSLSDISSENLIGLQGQTANDLHIQTAKAPSSSSIVVEVSFAAAALALAGGSVAIVDPFTARWFEKFSNLKALPVSNLASYDFALVEPVGRPSSLSSSKLQNHFIEEISSVVDTLG